MRRKMKFVSIALMMGLLALFLSSCGSVLNETLVEEQGFSSPENFQLQQEGYNINLSWTPTVKTDAVYIYKLPVNQGSQYYNMSAQTYGQDLNYNDGDLTFVASVNGTVTTFSYNSENDDEGYYAFVLKAQSNLEGMSRRSDEQGVYHWLVTKPQVRYDYDQWGSGDQLYMESRNQNGRSEYDADSFKIYRKAGSTGSWAEIDEIHDWGQSNYNPNYPALSPTQGMVYFYQVVAWKNGRRSASSDVVYAVKNTNLSLRSGTDGVVIQWNLIEGASSYSIEQQGTVVVTTTGNSALHDPGQNGRIDYSLSLVIGSDNVNDIDSESFDFQRLVAPTLTFEDWQNKLRIEANNGSVNNYMLFRREGVSGAYGSLYEGGSNEYTDDTRQADRVYYYYSLTGTTQYPSPTSNIVMIAPNLSLTAQNGQSGIHLSWTALSDPVEYKLYRDGTLIATVTENTYHDDSSLTNGNQYNYQIRVQYNGQSPSGYQGDAGIQYQPLTAPTISIDHEMNQIVMNAMNGNTFKVFQKIGVNGTWSEVSNSGSERYSYTPPADGNAHFYAAKSSNGSADSVTSNVVMIVGATTLTATPINGGLQLDWGDINDATYVLRRWREESQLSDVTNIVSSDYTDSGLQSNKNYSYKLFAVVDGIQSDQIANVNQVYQDLNTPVFSLNASDLQANVDNAQTVKLFKKDGVAGTWTEVGNMTAQGGNEYRYTPTMPGAGEIHFYQVVAYNGLQVSPTSSMITLVGNANLQLSDTTGGLQLTFTETAGVDGYQVKRWQNDTNEITLPTVTGSPYADTGLVANNEYQYALRLIVDGSVISNTAGSAQMRYAPLGTPVINVNEGMSQIDASAANSDSLKVFKKSGVAGTWSEVADIADTFDGNSYSYSYSNPSAGNVDFYYAIAYKSGGQASPSSNEVMIVGDLSLSMTSAAGGVQLDWTNLSGFESYELRRQRNGGSWTTFSGITTNSYLDESASDGDYYRYELFVYINGVKSNKVGDDEGNYNQQVAPEAPVLSFGGGNQLYYGASGADYYRVYRTVHNSGGDSSSTFYSGSNSMCTDDAPDSAIGITTYEYSVVAYNGGSSGLASPTSNVKVKLVNYSASNITQLAQTSGNAISWDAVPGATSYIVKRYANGSVNIGNPTGTSFLDAAANLSEGVYYSYGILVRFGNVSAEPEAQSNGEFYYPLKQVTNLNTTSYGTYVYVSWDSQNAADNGYQIHRSTSENGTYSQVGTTANDWSNEFNDNDPLTGGTTYWYKVRAVRGAELGEFSAPDSVVY